MMKSQSSDFYDGMTENDTSEKQRMKVQGRHTACQREDSEAVEVSKCLQAIRVEGSSRQLENPLYMTDC